MTLYVRKSTAHFAAGLLFLVGFFLGMETLGYAIHQRDPKPMFVKIPPQPEPVDVIQSIHPESCVKRALEASRSTLQQCRMEKTKRG